MAHSSNLRRWLAVVGVGSAALLGACSSSGSSTTTTTTARSSSSASSASSSSSSTGRSSSSSSTSSSASAGGGSGSGLHVTISGPTSFSGSAPLSCFDSSSAAGGTALTLSAFGGDTGITLFGLDIHNPASGQFPFKVGDTAGSTPLLNGFVVNVSDGGTRHVFTFGSSSTGSVQLTDAGGRAGSLTIDGAADQDQATATHLDVSWSCGA